MLESLESRMLMTSAISAEGVVTIVCTDRADRIEMARDVKKPRTDFVVKINGVEDGRFPVTAVKGLIVDFRGGDDRYFDNLIAAIPTTLLGGAGNDSLGGGLADDYIHGGPGHDSISGSYGKDTLNGGSGDDRMEGGPGRDRMLGSSGNDTAVTEGPQKDRFEAENTQLVDVWVHMNDFASSFELTIKKSGFTATAILDFTFGSAGYQANARFDRRELNRFYIRADVQQWLGPAAAVLVKTRETVTLGKVIPDLNYEVIVESFDGTEQMRLPFKG